MNRFCFRYRVQGQSKSVRFTMAKMALGKTLLSFVVILCLMVCVLEMREVQGTSLTNRDQGQNQTEMMELLKKLQARYVTH